jgi:hypothetical protein
MASTPHEGRTGVRTVGVDLAKADTTTAVCTIDWTPYGAVVSAPVLPASNAVVLAAANAPGVVAVALDAPFGWPTAMVAAVSSWRPGGRWADPKDQAFRLRRTDDVTATCTSKAVETARKSGASGLHAAVPLSVSADKIAMAAWRCCKLLDQLAHDPHNPVEVVTDAMGQAFAVDGRNRVVEAYPAAALAMWGIPREGYKKADEVAKGVRQVMLGAILRGVGDGWLHGAPGVLELYTATDHALDALVCALVARAAMLGLVDAVPTDDREAARAEGWIALPRADSLRSLSQRGTPTAGR